MDNIESKRIAYLLASLPEEGLLLLAKTTDQIHYWLTDRLANTLAAIAWIARQQLQPDPLQPLLKSGQLSRNDYNRIWSLVDYYQRLWALVQLTEPFIRELFEKANFPWPHQEPCDLFACIVKELANEEFSCCLVTYKESSATNNEKECRQLAKFLNGKPLSKELERKAERPIDRAKLAKRIWATLLLAIAQKNATRNNRALKHALEDFHVALARLFEYEATYHRIHGSYAWKDGKKIKGSRGGSYKNP
jgi:hypothetical protein